MFNEESLVIEYLSKITELILQMRYDHHMLTAAASAGGTQIMRNQENHKFGFALTKQQYKMENLITSKWNSSCTAITLEFFLQRKSDGQSMCVEQWQFCYEKEFALPSHNRRLDQQANNAANGQSSASGSRKLNQKNNADLKLAGLSRSIVVLLVNSPLWREYISSENRSYKNGFILDYKITFAKNIPMNICTSFPTQTLPLSSGTLAFSFFYLNDFQNLINKIKSPSSLSPNYKSAATDNSNTHKNQNNNGLAIHKKKYERERFLSEKIDPKDLFEQQPPSNISSSTIERPRMKRSDNNTFKFSFSDSEPLSDEEKKIISHHLKQSSVVSVYSRKDDITIISTPDEIAQKMSDGIGGDLQGFEIEMVLEDRQDPQIIGGNTKYQEKKDNQTLGTKSAIPEKAMPQVTVIEDDFDFQLIEEENDRPIDQAIKKLSNLINQHKLNIKTLKPQNTAFDLFQSLTHTINTY